MEVLIAHVSIKIGGYDLIRTSEALFRTLGGLANHCNKPTLPHSQNKRWLNVPPMEITTNQFMIIVYCVVSTFLSMFINETHPSHITGLMLDNTIFQLKVKQFHYLLKIRVFFD